LEWQRERREKESRKYLKRQVSEVLFFGTGA
jgi:hypothetical protein